MWLDYLELEPSLSYVLKGRALHIPNPAEPKAMLNERVVTNRIFAGLTQFPMFAPPPLPSPLAVTLSVKRAYH